MESAGRNRQTAKSCSGGRGSTFAANFAKVETRNSNPSARSTTSAVPRSSRSWKKYTVSARSGWWICAAYFDDKDIDGVVVATPEHWNALSTVWACHSGKDVYVEKCPSLSVWEGRPRGSLQNRP